MENENDKEYFHSLIVSLFGRGGDGESYGLDYDEVEDAIKQIRKKTLEAVLPTLETHKDGEGGYCDTGEDMAWYCRSDCVRLSIERLKAKAKELWGIEIK